MLTYLQRGAIHELRFNRRFVKVNKHKVYCHSRLSNEKEITYKMITALAKCSSRILMLVTAIIIVYSSVTNTATMEEKHPAQIITKTHQQQNVETSENQKPAEKSVSIDITPKVVKKNVWLI